MQELLHCLAIFCIGFGTGDGRSTFSAVDFGAAGDAKTFSVVDFGAVGDGKNDDSQAFLKAWEATCGAGGTPTLSIPAGKTFLLQPVEFQGPCKSTSVHVQLEGNLVAPGTPQKWSACESRWIAFEYVAGLIVDGSGQIDGQGAPWWKGASSGKCNKPTQMYFHGCNNLQVSGISLIDSPKNHISINSCTGVSMSTLHITAPENSPNTDGIDISASKQVNIINSFIGTGDDCIAINGGCSDINITHVTCSPGHGISVGSLGEHGVTETVENIHVQNCIFNRTQNGARIKTWQGGSGYAKSISFEQITLVDAGNPIIIDQHYDAAQNYAEEASAVAISDVKFIGFQGTSSDVQAITLDCSKAKPCNDIVLDQVNITSAVPGKQLRVLCNNVHGTSKSTVPTVACLSG